MTRRLRVGVRDHVKSIPVTSGHGRVWHYGLRELSRIADVEVFVRPPAPRSRRGSPDVWLIDGHEGPHHVRQPCVAIAHEAGWTTRELRSFLDPKNVAHIRSATGLAIASAERVIAPSASGLGELVEAYDRAPKSVAVVPYGVDHGTFRPAAGSVCEVDGPYVLFSASLSPRKNLGGLRDAMAILAREGLPHLLVLVAGDSPDRVDSSRLDVLASAELPGAPGRILRVRNPSDQRLAGLMANASAFCMPSFSEGFGLTVLEAMATGAPVVVSNRGSLPELVGDAAVIVEPDPAGITRGLRQVLTDSAAATRLGRAAIARAQEFSWERTARGWLEVLKDVVA